MTPQAFIATTTLPGAMANGGRWRESVAAGTRALALAAVFASAACSSQSAGSPADDAGLEASPSSTSDAAEAGSGWDSAADSSADGASTVVLCTDLGPFKSLDALPPGYVGEVNACSDCVPVDSGDCDPDSGPWCCSGR
jgi:hypothetical protein